ncbi:MAG: hypothetical protein NTV54_08565 [Ignavibacteriales bacterium]|nr:hypothetical protein [Ignavibacteriales bacterium]
MKYSIEIANAHRMNGMKDFVISELKRHCTTWSREVGRAAYSLKVIRKTLVFTTNSNYLMTKWVEVEQPFVDYLLSGKHELVDEIGQDLFYGIAA